MELNGNAYGCTMHNKVVAVAAQFNASALHKAFAIYDILNEKLPTTLQSMMNAKLSKQMFWHWYENGFVKTIQTIPHNLYVSWFPFTEDYDKPG